MVKIVLLIIFYFTFSAGNFGAPHSPVTPIPNKVEVIFGVSFHNYLPDSPMRINIEFKNRMTEKAVVSQELVVLDSTGVKVWDTVINLELAASQNIKIPLIVPTPKFSGIFTLTIPKQMNRPGEAVPVFQFEVLEPGKSARLAKILVHTPDSEEGLNAFITKWGIKAPTISWGQVLLCGKKTTTKFAAGDEAVIQLISRALKREMSVIFLDFGPSQNELEKFEKIMLPFNVSAGFIRMKSPEQNFVIKPGYKELTFNFRSDLMDEWNGLDGISVPSTDMRFDGKGVKINAVVTAGKNPYRFPVVELIPLNGKGKLYLCQLITDGRLDDAVKPVRNHPELPAYDPKAVQFVLNLISAAVGDNLLK